MSSTTLNTSDDRTYVGNEIPRLPSPTPSEVDLLNTPGRRLFGFNTSKTKRRPWYYYVILIVILAIIILFAVFQKQIVHWLEPGAKKIKDLPAGFLIPIAIFIIISFPPLFGQEILAILVGLVWGLWIGFAITCAGTLIGEILNFFAFKYFFRNYAEKLEREKVRYAALAKIVREGGLLVAVVVRYSFIPNHFVTAIFAVCGMNFWIFLASAVLSLPLHFVTVFMGQALQDEDSGKNSSLDKIVNYVSLAVTILVTYAAMIYIGRELDKVKHELVRERRIARAGKLSTAEFSYDDASRAELGPLIDNGSEYERPAFGGQYTPVNHGNPPTYSTPAYPSSSYAPDNDTLTPYGGGYAPTRYNPPTGPPPSSQYAPDPSDKTPRQSYDNRSRESFDMQEMPPRTVQSSIP